MAKVDVLAVLDAEIAFALDEAKHFRITHERADGLIATRAAVVELIEAASGGIAMQSNGGPTTYFNPQKTERLRAALAQVSP